MSVQIPGGMCGALLYLPFVVFILSTKGFASCSKNVLSTDLGRTGWDARI